MTLLLDTDQLDARRLLATHQLSPLARGLRADLEPLLRHPVDVPTGKAALSRAGGRCAVDGALLAFDPWDARHRCPRCGREYHGPEHDGFRLYWYQLWLAERVLHLALLAALTGDVACRAEAMRLLDAYAARYLEYPNRDNVLGPSRPFFSTYLESIWLLQLALALDLLETGAPGPDVSVLGGRVRDRLVAPSVALIASYDEGTSNRQVWNNAALIAGGALLGHDALREHAINGASGLSAQLGSALLGDGSWYEGENYHLFAHRGLWYGVQMAESAGIEIAPDLVARFQEGFAAPFRTVLPDLTYPSRRDSQYAVSVRQPRFAESCELGLARGDDPRLVGMLARLYAGDIPCGDTGRASSTADVERNLPATSLTRADLSWRSLLFARAELPPLVPVALGSELLPDQGFGILRRDGGRLYAALDFGHGGGGHGHPDRLNLLLMERTRRWFDDPGTGSYVDESLHWYRSTLAHTAPLVDGRSQPRVHGMLTAFDDRGDFGWISARVELADDLEVRRTIVVGSDYLIDELTWDGDEPHDVALPLHGVTVLGADGAPAPSRPAVIEGSDEPEDGFRYLASTSLIEVPAGVVRLRSSDPRDGRVLNGWAMVPGSTRWFAALAPRAPSLSGLEPLVLVRAREPRASYTMVWSWGAMLASVQMDAAGRVVVARSDGSVHTHERHLDDWRVAVEGGERQLIQLGGAVRAAKQSLESDEGELVIVSRDLPDRHLLGEHDYRRSESSWAEAGSPVAAIDLERMESGVRITVDLRASERLFVDVDAENPLDNEPAAINGDGVQLYLAFEGTTSAWLLVPSGTGSDVHRRGISGWGDEIRIDARWTQTTHGYRLWIDVPVPNDAQELAVGLIVNETTAGRARRRGQLVLGGARGEFVYLRGDRNDPSRLLRYSLRHD